MRWAGNEGGGRAADGAGEPGYELFAAHSPGAFPRSCQTFLDTGRAVSLAALAGIVAGSVVAALELNPGYNYNTWLYMSFATGSLGVWAIVSVVLADRSVSPRQAALRTLSFMVAVVLTYFAVRYVNYLGGQERLLRSMSEVMDGRFTAMRHTPFWGPEKLVSLGLGLALAGSAVQNLPPKTHDADDCDQHQRHDYRYNLLFHLPLTFLQMWMHSLPVQIGRAHV